MTEPAYLTQVAGTSRYLTRVTDADAYLTLQSPTAYVNDIEAMLAEAVWYIDAHQASSSQTVPNLGTGGTALDATLGSSGSADSNDPKFLDFDGVPYIYNPSADGNGLTVPDADNLDITGDIDLIARVAPEVWAQGSTDMIIHKGTQTTQRAYSLMITATGGLSLQWTVDGTTIITKTSTAVVPYADNVPTWVRVTLDVDDGAGNNVVTFYTAPGEASEPSWTQLGDVVTTAGTTSIYVSAQPIYIGSRANVSFTFAGKIYRAIVKNGIDGTPVLDVDCSVLTSGAATTFTEQSSNAATVTINRSSSGRKATVVHGGAGGGSVWLFGTDDYMEVADNALLDFGASDSFTVLAVVRQWATPTNNGTYLAKYDSATTIGYLIGRQNTTTTNRFVIADGTSTPVATSTGANGPLAVVTGRRDVSGDTITSYTDTTPGSGVTDSTTGTLANTFPLYVGRRSGTATYQDFEFTAAAVWRRALTATEIAALSDYFTTRAHDQSY